MHQLFIIIDSQKKRKNTPITLFTTRVESTLSAMSWSAYHSVM